MRTRSLQPVKYPVLSRFRAVPFEGAFAMLAIISGTAGVMGVGMGSALLSAVFTEPFRIAFYLAYLIAGVLMLVGIGSARAQVEVLGVVWLAMVAVIQDVLYVVFAIRHPEIWEDVIIATAFYLVLLLACASRARGLLRHEKLVRVESA